MTICRLWTTECGLKSGTLDFKDFSIVKNIPKTNSRFQSRAIFVSRLNTGRPSLKDDKPSIFNILRVHSTGAGFNVNYTTLLVHVAIRQHFISVDRLNEIYAVVLYGKKHAPADLRLPVSAMFLGLADRLIIIAMGCVF